MKKSKIFIKNFYKKVKSEISKSKLAYLFLFLLLIVAFILRVWDINELLGFYYDQGRDALVIARLLQGDVVLIGPTTGLTGIFLGPFYYYFMAPGYFIGGGNPVIASYWQSFFIILGYLLIFILLRLYFSIRAGIIAVFSNDFFFCSNHE